MTSLIEGHYHRCNAPGCRRRITGHYFCCGQHRALLGDWRLNAEIHTAWLERKRNPTTYEQAKRRALQAWGYLPKDPECPSSPTPSR